MNQTENLTDICISCAEIERRPDYNLIWSLLGHEIGLAYLMYESDNFIVVPGAGAIVPGYSLIIPKQHILSMGFLNTDLDIEFAQLVKGVCSWALDAFELEPHVFEHGAKNFTEKGGACADHAHTQVAPLGATTRFVDALRSDFDTMDAAEYLPSARAMVKLGEGDPYLYTHSQSGGAAIAIATGAKGQYFRRIMATHAGNPDHWDGTVFPERDNMRKTLEAGHELRTYFA